MALAEVAKTVWVCNTANDAVAKTDQEHRIEDYIVHDGCIADLRLREPLQLGPNEVQEGEDGAVEEDRRDDEKLFTAASAP